MELKEQLRYSNDRREHRMEILTSEKADAIRKEYIHTFVDVNSDYYINRIKKK